jgi:hypothetical protein
MKVLIAVLIVFAILTGCEKDNGGGNENTTRVKITGKLPTTKSAGLDAQSATKVLLFNVSGEHTVSDISNGTFSIQVNKDEPVGLIFTNENKNFLGYLKLSEGIASLPLNHLNDTVSVVNLGNLTTDGGTVSSGSNILTQYMNMSQDQIQGYRYANVNFSLFVKNPDTDRNGVIDLLEGKFHRLTYIYFADGGTYNRTPSKLSNINLDAFRIMFITSDVSTPEGITFSNLIGNNSYFTNTKGGGTNHTIYWSEVFPVNTPLNAQCQVLYNNQTLYFDLPTFATTINNFIYVFPTLNYDSSGKLNKVSWEYYSGTTGGQVDATKIITDIIAQFDGGSSRIYDSSNLGPEKKETTISTPLAASSITNFHIAYNDIFGNHVVVSYHPQ